MLQEKEVVTLILGAGVLVSFWVGRRDLRQFPAWKIFAAGFHLLLLGWALTVLEAFFLGNLLNTLEHACYAASSAVLAVWCWRVLGARGEAHR